MVITDKDSFFNFFVGHTFKSFSDGSHSHSLSTDKVCDCSEGKRKVAEIRKQMMGETTQKFEKLKQQIEELKKGYPKTTTIEMNSVSKTAILFGMLGAALACLFLVSGTVTMAGRGIVNYFSSSP